MGTIATRKGKRGNTFRAAVCVKGIRESKSFKAKAEARAWMDRIEGGLIAQKLPDKTVKQAFIRYTKEESPKHKGAKFEELRLLALGKMPLGAIKLAALKGPDLAAWRVEREKTKAPATVLREMTLLNCVFVSCVKDWGWLTKNPLKGVSRPAKPRGRRRRITAAQVEAVTGWLGYQGGEPANATQRVAVAFLFALETAMRSGEIVGLRWDDAGEYAVQLPETKNGDAREVPLSVEARRLLTLLPRGASTVFGLVSAQRDALFRKSRPAEHRDIHFHDSRAEAIWRLSKKLDVLELAAMIGHRDLNSLLAYYKTSASELSAKLG